MSQGTGAERQPEGRAGGTQQGQGPGMGLPRTRSSERHPRHHSLGEYSRVEVLIRAGATEVLQQILSSARANRVAQMHQARAVEHREVL